MGHSALITDYVDIYNEKWELLYKKVWSYWDLSKWKWILAYKGDKIIKEGYFFIRKVNDEIHEEYIIEDVQYKSHPRIQTANNITLQVYKKWKQRRQAENNNPTIVNNIENSYGIAGINNGIQNITQIHNDVDSIIWILNESNIINKEDLIKELEKFKISWDKRGLESFISLFANTGTINSTIIIPIMTFLLKLNV